MKKLKLQALQLGAKEVLSRSQLKEILGGDGSGGSGGTGWSYCTAKCPGTPHDNTCAGFTGYACTATDGLGCTGYHWNSGNPVAWSYPCGSNN